jgi:CheY-like chemotaxis protein
MSSEVSSRIFDPFFTTKGTAGLGLGLAVGFGIIRRHEGSIEVESTINQGTTFRITLPVASVAHQGPAVDPVLETDVQPEPSSLPEDDLPRFLIVDDEEHVRELLRDVLEVEGYTVYLATGGREALALFDECKFDGVFTDVGMPEMNGWELSSAIRKRNEEIPIAVITGWGEAVGSKEQKEAGVNWVISKPFNVDRIVELAEEIKERRNVVRDPRFTFVAA